MLPAQDLFAGQQGTVRVRISNQGTLPSYLLHVSIDDASMLVPAIVAGTSEEVRLPLMMPERGLRPAPAVHLSSCFPVNFFVRYYQFDLSQLLLVFPRPIVTAMPSQETSFLAAAGKQTVTPGGDGDLRSIEDYRAGDPPKTIHWKLSARHQELKTKQMSRQAEETRLLDLEHFDGSVEERLGRCAYLVNHCFRQNCAVGLHIAGRTITPRAGRGQRLRLLKELALYE
ncbi:MAG: DUF58 domain-containing protein [Pelovirga sp.]